MVLFGSVKTYCEFWLFYIKKIVSSYFIYLSFRKIKFIIIIDAHYYASHPLEVSRDKQAIGSRRANRILVGNKT